MRTLTLTFDNGPHPDVTPGVLDELSCRNILATFFVIGRNLEDPAAHAAMDRAHASGHWIGNHTWNHAEPLGRRDEADLAEREIGRTQRLLDASGVSHPDRLFRPNGGGGAIGPWLLDRACLDYLEVGEFTCVLWNSVPRDWEQPGGWVELALAHCAAQDWTLMVLHDIPTGAMRLLPRFLDAVTDAGIRIRQDFPPACVPLLRGRAATAMAPYVAR
jgi:peptidoglycan-N-acetylglucosamine deacetylase